MLHHLKTAFCNLDSSHVIACHLHLTCTVATSPLALRWMCDSPRTGCERRTTPHV